ncbi:MAG: dihydropteroate synthase [Acidimicrobiaceae bacterium]|nr:dihydropteroate synthase [Acidimicrobiaceae bacterium]
MERDLAGAYEVDVVDAPRREQFVRLGNRRYDVTHRALVMGILNRTRDSFFAPAATFDLDSFLARADELVRGGADLLDVGGVKAGPGEPVSLDEELSRVIPALELLRSRFDVAVSIDTWRAEVARAAFGAGAVLGNDISGFADPDYLAAAAGAGASVVATHIRLAPRVADPTPVYGDVVEEVRTFLLERREWARGAGLADDQIILDAGLDLGKTAAQSLTLLRASSSLAAEGPLLLSASNKTFLGVMFSLEVLDRRDASLSAAAIGVLGGCRILRVHDVVGTVRVRDLLATLSEAT